MTAPRPIASPLTDQDRDDIDKALKTSAQASELIEKAGQAGLDVEAFRQRNRDARDRLLRIKQTFFPG